MKEAYMACAVEEVWEDLLDTLSLMPSSKSLWPVQMSLLSWSPRDFLVWTGTPRWNVNHPMGLWAIISLGCHVLGLICSFQHPAGCFGPGKSRRHGRPSKEGYLPQSGPQPPFCACCSRNCWHLWRRHYCLP